MAATRHDLNPPDGLDCSDKFDDGTVDDSMFSKLPASTYAI